VSAAGWRRGGDGGRGFLPAAGVGAREVVARDLESGAPQPETRQVERVRLRLTLGRWEESAGGAALGQRCEVWGVGKGTCVKATQMGSGRDQGLGIWG
jgi:hypothetical protein